MTLSIRPATLDDAAEVARVHVQADRETYQAIFGRKFREVELSQSQARWTAALVADAVFLVAEDDGAIVGFAQAHENWLSALYLLASHRRQGMGARLLAEVRQQLAARGVAEIGFQCVADNAAAIAFYEAQGARQTGRKLEGEGDDAWWDVVFVLATSAAG
ncbi:MAG TPA: GNAT family N-acetyltransferase [Caulobacteraceae bacterium]|jgi:ribosomal protein S18 acetylase RimI-like enzyme